MSTVDTAVRPAPAIVLWGIAIVAAAHVGYLVLLLTCDALRVSPLGFEADFQPGSMIVSAVHPHSMAGRAHLQVGDRIVSAGGQVVEGRMDWRRVRANIDPALPLALQVERAGVRFATELELATEPPALLPSSRPGLLAFRAAQVITLGLAILVAVRRASQPPALLGAVLLAAIATVSLVLPMRMAAFSHAVPSPIDLLLWLPSATSVAVGPLLLAFFAIFPRRLWSRRRLGLILLPALLVVVWSVYANYQITRAPGAATGLPDLTVWVFGVNVIYALGAVAMLLIHGRSAETLTDRRRIRVLGVGLVIGVAAGAVAVAGYWRNPGADIFATRTLTVPALLFLAVPASFAYAILRHRLFDVRLILRQGVRYALARGFFQALIPALGVLLLADVLIQRREPLLTSLQSRWWWYAIVGAALILARSRREAWLKGLDRRFFRDRYDAQRLLKNIADQIRLASDFDTIAPTVIAQIDRALHPEFVDVLRHSEGESVFAPVTIASPERLSEPLPDSFTVIGLLAVLGKPLALSLGDTAWVRHQLPAEERELLGQRGIELLVPIASLAAGTRQPVALLVLGPRRSEEPYNEEDLELLDTIAHALGQLLHRPRSEVTHVGVSECARCGRCFDGGTHVCPEDQEPLTVLGVSRALNGRYRLDRRLGRGGMGAVYAAIDEALERTVAVKLIRDDLVGSSDLNARFRREARAAAGFAHPNVVRVYDFGVDRDARAFLVMELLEGQTLRQRLTSHAPLREPEVLLILRGVCAAVGAAHQQGLVHRDLKPENIFLQQLETAVLPKVLDFGLAKAFGARWPIDRAKGTDTGLLVGTLEYMAPEQAAGDLVCPAWDIWALAVVTHEMLTGRHPFRRTITLDNGQPFDASHAAASPPLPAAMSAFLSTALASQQAPRPKDALDFLRGFEQAL